jgi:hypothetical protein
MKPLLGRKGMVGPENSSMLLFTLQTIRAVLSSFQLIWVTCLLNLNAFSGICCFNFSSTPENPFGTAPIVCKVNNSVEEFYADHVIVTCSLGHLKQYHDSLFNPALPKCKVDAIERMGFGNVVSTLTFH